MPPRALNVSSRRRALLIPQDGRLPRRPVPKNGPNRSGNTAVQQRGSTAASRLFVQPTQEKTEQG